VSRAIGHWNDLATFVFLRDYDFYRPCVPMIHFFSVIDDSIGCIKSEYDRYNDDREGDGCGYWFMRESKISSAVFDDAEIRRQLGKQQK
jgi:hypothetical protein